MAEALSVIVGGIISILTTIGLERSAAHSVPDGFALRR